MLLEFKAKNYKSFKDELVFSMTPAPKQKGLDYSVFQEKIGKDVYKGLCSAVIYGANASGKTNIIGAMDTFKSILLRGHIRNVSSQNIPNAAAASLELIPNNGDSVGQPVTFSIRFITRSLLVEYSFSANLGEFLEINHSRKVLSEMLHINGNLIFARRKKLEFGDLNCIREYLVNNFDQNEESAKILAASNLNDEELFLTNGFKAMFSAGLVTLMMDWMIHQFVIVYRANSIQLIQESIPPKEYSISIEKMVKGAAASLGIHSNALEFVADRDEGKARLCSVFENKNLAIPAEIFESHGTVRFVRMFPRIVKALASGGTLVIDEFDTSIHSTVLMDIINIFHNNEVNIHHAQLIFNTHNPIFLNPSLYRRDEIHFVERDEDSSSSTHYTLADFRTAGEKGVRKNENYMKSYFMGRYGAIRDIDFTPVFASFLSLEGKEVFP